MKKKLIHIFAANVFFKSFSFYRLKLFTDKSVSVLVQHVSQLFICYIFVICVLFKRFKVLRCVRPHMLLLRASDFPLCDSTHYSTHTHTAVHTCAYTRVTQT